MHHFRRWDYSVSIWRAAPVERTLVAVLGKQLTQEGEKMMQKLVVSAVVLTLVVVTLSTFVGCSQHDDLVFGQVPAPGGSGGSAPSLDPALVGRWEHTTENWTEQLHLLKDGTALRYTNGIKGAGNGFTWRAENGRFYQFDNGGREGWWRDYKLSGTSLTFIVPERDGKSTETVFKKR